MKLEFTGYTKGNKIVMHNKKGFTESVLTAWPDNEIVFTVQKKTKIRSNDQNAWIWGVAYPAILIRLLKDGIVWDKDFLHNLLIRELMPHDTMFLPSGKAIRKDKVPTRKSSEFTTVEFSHFMEMIVLWAAETLHIEIPMPEEKDESPLFEND